MATYKCCISIMIGSNSTGNLVDCITIQNEILLEGKRGVMCQKNAGLGQGMGVTPKIFFVRHRTSPFLHWQCQCSAAVLDPASRRLNGTHLGTPRALLRVAHMCRSTISFHCCEEGCHWPG